MKPEPEDLNPCMRFSSFDEPWQRTTLGQLFDFKNGINADKSQYGSGTKFVNVLDVMSESPLDYDSIKLVLRQASRWAKLPMILRFQFVSTQRNKLPKKKQSQMPVHQRACLLRHIEFTVNVLRESELMSRWLCNTHTTTVASKSNEVGWLGSKLQSSPQMCSIHPSFGVSWSFKFCSTKTGSEFMTGVESIGESVVEITRESKTAVVSGKSESGVVSGTSKMRWSQTRNF